MTRFIIIVACHAAPHATVCRIDATMWPVPAADATTLATLSTALAMLPIALSTNRRQHLLLTDSKRT